jgi:hypothetical protein
MKPTIERLTLNELLRFEVTDYKNFGNRRNTLDYEHTFASILLNHGLNFDKSTCIIGENIRR